MCVCVVCRKVPAHIDVEALPDIWFCENSSWAEVSCDVPGDSEDDDNIPAVDHDAGAQLILNNSKNQSMLSYRRIIFGPDGKIRPNYSEKNKNGYGIFSSTEIFRQSGDVNEYVMPTRRIGYWGSSCYDHATGSKLVAAAAVESSSQSKSPKTNITSEFSPMAQQQHQQQQDFPPAFVMQPREPTHLIDAIQRRHHARAVALSSSSSSAAAAGQDINNNCHSSYGPGKKWTRVCLPAVKDLSLFGRLVCMSTVVSSCMIASATKIMTLHKLLRLVQASRFCDDPVKESCRRSLSEIELLETLRHLEDSGRIDVTFDNDSKICFQLISAGVAPIAPMDVGGKKEISVNPFPDIVSPLYYRDDDDKNPTMLPLKMRKKKLEIIRGDSSSDSGDNGGSSNE